MQQQGGELANLVKWVCYYGLEEDYVNERVGAETIRSGKRECRGQTQIATAGAGSEEFGIEQAARWLARNQQATA